jgi:hypothetical protein
MANEGREMDVEFRVYQDGKVIFRAVFKLPEAAPASQINEFHKTAHEQFFNAHPAVKLDGEGVEERWAKPGEPD